MSKVESTVWQLALSSHLVVKDVIYRCWFIVIQLSKHPKQRKCPNVCLCGRKCSGICFFFCIFSGWRGVGRRRVHCERRLHSLRTDSQAGVLRHGHGPAQTGKNLVPTCPYNTLNQQVWQYIISMNEHFGILFFLLVCMQFLNKQ